ncbi:hypothetical protein C8R45DRAFT_946730 [Mycena sanguinolenta]|nr:hypothetical protein C8R45DRAFT_946730 [Mycena sanguinolenta]
MANGGGKKGEKKEGNGNSAHHRTVMRKCGTEEGGPLAVEKHISVEEEKGRECSAARQIQRGGNSKCEPIAVHPPRSWAVVFSIPRDTKLGCDECEDMSLDTDECAGAEELWDVFVAQK